MASLYRHGCCSRNFDEENITTKNISIIGLFGGGKELGRKMSTTRNNVYKVEAAVYALRVRGGEAPPTLLVPTKPDWEQRDHSDDEGYF